MKIMPRRLQGSGGKSDAPTVESRLDDFIERANNELVDISDFSPEKQAEREQAAKREAEERQRTAEAREQKHEERSSALERQVTELQQRIVQMQSRKKPSQGWGKLVVGFVLGCGSMFAVSALMPPRERIVEKQAAAAPTPVTTPAPVAAPVAPVAAPPVVTPIESAPVAQPSPVAQPTPAPAPPPATAPVVEKQPEKKRHHTAPKPDAAKPVDVKPAPTQPAAGSGSDLYNPF